MSLLSRLAGRLAGRFVAGLAVLLCLLGLPVAGASAENPFCGLPTPSFSQKRVCESATLAELERKLGRLEQELDSGWHVPTLEAGDQWRAQVLPACRSDACLEAAYRERLGALDALPAFVCSGRLNRAERLVCQTPALGRLDRALNHAYSVALDTSYATLAVRAAQARWRLGVRDACAGVDCLTRAYRARLLVMQQESARSAKRSRQEQATSGGSVADGGAAGASVVPGSFRFSPAQQKSVQAQMGADFTDDDLNRGGCLRRPTELLDLNRDGHPDPVFTSCSMALDEQKYFFLWERGNYRLILTDSVGYFGYQLQDTQTHGLPVLRLVTHGSCCEHPHAFYGYDGHVYRAVACFDERFLREDFYVFQYARPTGLHC
ncbi:hypothetical protein [Deinococcus altitudinis]|uniref:hypothetical protein n=1 Tax=Deinococcus altitudinis TaxID=468914 RepID=UPI00389239B2